MNEPAVVAELRFGFCIVVGLAKVGPPDGTGPDQSTETVPPPPPVVLTQLAKSVIALPTGIVAADAEGAQEGGVVGAAAVTVTSAVAVAPDPAALMPHPRAL